MKPESFPLREAAGIVGGEAGLLESVQGPSGVVTHPAHRLDMLFIIIECVGCAGVTITRLADFPKEPLIADCLHFSFFIDHFTQSPTSDLRGFLPTHG